METWPKTTGVVEFPDGRVIRARGLRHPQPSGPEPEFGIYLLGSPPPEFEWEQVWINWRDFRVPSDPESAIATLRDGLNRAESQRVEIACGGGIGRTGTALAAIAVMAGIPGGEAVAWVRSNYHPRAVETPWQKRWVRRLQLDPS